MNSLHHARARSLRHLGAFVATAALCAQANAATEVITADHFALNQINWDGSSHQQGGVARVGGYLRNPLTAYDFETLASFDVSGIEGTITSARLAFFVQSSQSFGPQTVELFEQDILGSFDPANVSYSTFNDGPFSSQGWSNLLGSASVDSTTSGWVQIESDALKSLVQSWVNDPSTNTGVVLTGTFWYWDAFINVNAVELELEVENGGRWEVVGEENILGFSPGGPHDLALTPDGTPYIAVRHVGPQACPMCPPPLEPHVARFNGSQWEDLDPDAFPLGQFPAVEVTSDGVPITVVQNQAWQFNGATWNALPNIPSQFSHPSTLPEFDTGSGNTPFVAMRSTSGSSVLALSAGAWSEVGGGPLPLSDVFSGPSLSVTSDGRPVVAVRGPNEGTTAIIDVLEFDGTSWVPIGPTIRAERVFTPIALAITPDGTPFVGFSTTFTTLTARVVLRFDGTSWVGTGPVLVPGGMAFQGVQTLTVSPLDGVPHSISSFFDFALGQDRRAVVRWTGNEWLPLTQTGYRIGNENPGVETKLEISQAGIPFVLYQNEIGGFTVKQFIEE